jgi:SAM-dependent methyltransferase
MAISRAATTEPADPRDLVAELIASSWALVALAAALESGIAERMAGGAAIIALSGETGIPVALVERLADVLVALGLARRDRGELAPTAAGEELLRPHAIGALRAELSGALLQGHDVFLRSADGDLTDAGWRHTDARILQAQGTQSAGAIDYLEHVLFPRLDGALERLAAPSAAFLDVGAGVGAVTIEMCRRFPALRAVALEPQAAPLALARANVARAGLGDRVDLRRGLVQELPDRESFDVAWLPLNFLAPGAVAPALQRVAAALRPGGWVVLGTLGEAGRDVVSTTARLRATLWSGSSLAPDRVAEALDAAGFGEITRLPRFASGLVPMHARRPPA